MTSFPVTSRRRFLRQVLGWSALSATAPLAHATRIAQPDKSAAHALILGDWGWLDVVGPDDLRGGTGFVAQTQVAQGMRKFVQSMNSHPDALFMLGDSWYGDLAEGALSRRWKTQFEEMYPVELFPGPVYTMLGNHDYQHLPANVNKVEAELEYARMGRGVNDKPTRWTLPARWYTFDFPAASPLMHCIVLDSNMPSQSGRVPAPPNFTLTLEEQAEQLRWLEQQLARSRTAPFLVVMGHHPVYSNGPHGDHPVLIRDWDPLFRQHKVDLYLAGHDHDLQVLHFEDHPTTHVLSGGGGADLYVLKTDDLNRGPYAQEVHGFSHLTVTSHELQVRQLDSSGRFLFGISKTPQGKLSILSA
jgi:tartrate-resistant acid phosphatase type 5